MNVHIIRIIVASIIIGIIEHFTPQGRGFERYTKYIGALCILSISITPISSLISSINDGLFDDIKDSIIGDSVTEKDEYSDLLKDYLNNYSSEELRVQIVEILEKEFDIPENECTVSISLDRSGDKLVIGYIRILLSGNSIFKNPYKIEEFFAEKLQCKCEVLIKRNGGE